MNPCCFIRLECGHCGIYDVRMELKPDHDPEYCLHCGRDGVRLIGLSVGWTDREVPFIGQAHLRTSDWVKGGNRRTGKSTGRPRKHGPGIVVRAFA